MDDQPHLPHLAALLAARPLAPLGPGTPVEACRERLAGLTDADLCGGPVADAEALVACRCGLWLAWNFLDEAHALTQGLETAEGSWWHAIMHRREPDYGNSKYWYARVGPHPLLAELAESARLLAAGVAGAPDWVRSEGGWEMARWVDLAAGAARPGGAHVALATGLQDAEWQLLFAWCWRAARGV